MTIWWVDDYWVPPFVVQWWNCNVSYPAYNVVVYSIFLKVQILKTGFFHADPHPGNLAVDLDEALIYYDFGMMGEIKSFTRERLLDLFYAVYEKDAKKVYFQSINCSLWFFFCEFRLIRVWCPSTEIGWVICL